MVPVDTKEKTGFSFRSLVMKDLSVFRLEQQMMRLEEYPSFWVYYCTMGSDVLGRLTLTPTELIFEPLNDNFKGYVSYSGRRIIIPEGAEAWDGLTMSLVVNYEDICVPETRKVTIVKPVVRTCYVKVSLFQTGNM